MNATYLYVYTVCVCVCVCVYTHTLDCIVTISFGVYLVLWLV